jgi:hypothetical protein
MNEARASSARASQARPSQDRGDGDMISPHDYVRSPRPRRGPGLGSTPEPNRPNNGFPRITAPEGGEPPGATKQGRRRSSLGAGKCLRDQRISRRCAAAAHFLKAPISWCINARLY